MAKIKNDYRKEISELTEELRKVKNESTYLNEKLANANKIIEILKADLEKDRNNLKETIEKLNAALETSEEDRIYYRDNYHKLYHSLNEIHDLLTFLNIPAKPTDEEKGLSLISRLFLLIFNIKNKENKNEQQM